MARCFVVETDDGVLVELGDRVVMRFRTLGEFLGAFELGRDDLREITP